MSKTRNFDPNPDVGMPRTRLNKHLGIVNDFLPIRECDKSDRKTNNRIIGSREMIYTISVAFVCYVSESDFSFTQISPMRTNRAKDYPTTSVRCCGHRPFFRFTHVKTQYAVYLSVCLSIITIIIGTPHIIHSVSLALSHPLSYRRVRSSLRTSHSPRLILLLYKYSAYRHRQPVKWQLFTPPVKRTMHDRNIIIINLGNSATTTNTILGLLGPGPRGTIIVGGLHLAERDLLPDSHFYMW
ncbi:hypothetical protein QTP88_004874 [Uroleucon formosanum]